MPSSPGSHGSMYSVGVDASRGQRREEPGDRIDDLDRDVVVADEIGEPLRDLVEDRPRIERREDRLGDLEQVALADELPLEGRGLRPQEASAASASANAWAAKLA